MRKSRKKAKPIGRVATKWEQIVRISATPIHEDTCPIALARAGELIGKTLRIGKAVEYLAKRLPRNRIFAADPCDCGKPNCLNLKFGTIGYLDGYLDIWKVAQGKQYILLRYDPIPESEVRVGPN